MDAIAAVGRSYREIMKEFHPLTIERIRSETADSVRIALAVPEELRDEYRFLPGQHLPFQALIDGKKLRRTYSICSAQGEYPLEIGVRVQPGGKFSEFAATSLKAGDTLEAMPPSGQFHVEPNPENANDYVGFAAGRFDFMNRTTGVAPRDALEEVGRQQAAA